MMDASYADHTVQIFTYLLLFMGGLQSGKTKQSRQGGGMFDVYFGSDRPDQIGESLFFRLNHPLDFNYDLL